MSRPGDGAAVPRRARRRAAMALALLLAAPAAAAAHAAPSHEVDLVVRTRAEAPSRVALQRAVPAVRLAAVRRLAPHTAVVTVRSSATTSAVRAALERSRQVVDTALDRRLRIAGTVAPVASGARAAAKQWDLWDARSTRRAGGYGMDASRAWTRTLGSPDVVVAVLDTGITPHPDLRGASLVPGYDFVSGAEDIGTGDGDGWDADPSDPGDACRDAGEPSSWHGTFVAGEVVGRLGGGAAGAAPGVSLMPVRVLGSCGGAESDAIAAITWASGGQVPGVPDAARRADVLSMSLGSADGRCPAALQAAFDGAVSRGTVVVAAAGNDGDDVASSSPANCRGVVAVTATTRQGLLAGYSNRGTGRLAPAIAAPGGSGGDPVVGAGWTSRTTARAAGNTPVLRLAVGTSMAAPRVAAAAALLLSVRPGLTPAQVADRLGATATRFPARSACTPTICGAGIVNAGSLVGAARRFVLADPVGVTGTWRPGSVLKARAGRWRPEPAAVRYLWLRDGRPIAGATSRTLHLRARDAGHRIAVRVTVRRAGAVTAATTSHSRRVRPA
ncbi:S8 family serine peptidase [Amnibacterium endophyticum]|uniref:S8 family serine peptidase n=1 Tax=Amnibacterium endophyticum TaxID=2109337 RepID=A0ABW4LD08_9MICO